MRCMAEQNPTWRLVSEQLERQGWTQVELANRLGKSEQSVSNWRNGHNGAPLKVLLKIAEITGSRLVLEWEDPDSPERTLDPSVAALVDAIEALRRADPEGARVLVATLTNLARLQLVSDVSRKTGA
jgi:transcriptional regulator with XRE-family HTH domain